MDCNKDEATRAKEIAERKFSAHDITGAKKFALKAQALFPALEGVSQMLSVLDVYASAENKTNGEADWYGILGVDHQADEETIRRQYRKLALTLHPDKNSSAGADGAFKLISEAWNLLSDKAKRTAYDQKIHAMSRPKAPVPRAPCSGANGRATATTKKPPKNRAAPGPVNTPVCQNVKISTFWSVCYRCQMRYEYPRAFENQLILCPSCLQPFPAVEVALPVVKGRWSTQLRNIYRQQ